MMKFRLSMLQEPKNANLMYQDNVFALPIVKEITTEEEFKEVVTTVQHSIFEWTNGQRNSLYLKTVNGIIIDFDDKTTIEMFKDSPVSTKYNWILYTSKSHQVSKGNKPAVDRFHVLFPFAQPFNVTEENIEDTWELVSNFCEILRGTYGLNPDKQVSDTARYIHPSRERGKEFSSKTFEIMINESSDYLSFDEIMLEWASLSAKRNAVENVREKTAAGKEKFNHTQFVNMLEWLAKGKQLTYDEFRDIGFFIHKNYADGDGQALFLILNKNPLSPYSKEQTAKKFKQLEGRGERNVIPFGRIVNICKEVSERTKEAMKSEKDDYRKRLVESQSELKVKTQKLKELKLNKSNDTAVILEKEQLEKEIATYRTQEALAKSGISKIDAVIDNYSFSQIEMAAEGVQEVVDPESNEAIEGNYETTLKFTGINCIDFFNSFCAYYNETGEFIVNRKGNKPSFMKNEQMKLEFASLRITRIVENEKGVKKPIIEQAFDVWTKSPKRRTVNRLINEPLHEAAKDEWNMCYDPYTIEPEEFEKEELKVFTNYIKEAICSGNEELATYLIKWVAAVTQFKKTKVAIIIKGEQGSGKSTLSTIFEKMLSPNYTYVTGNIKNVTGDFNAAIQNKVAITLEEAVFHKDYSTVNQLKDMITSDNISINEKFKSTKNLKSLANFIFTSNASEVINIETGDRRYCVIETNPDYAKYINNVVNPKNLEMFNKLYNWLQNEKGYQKLLKYLINLKVDVMWLQNNIPSTDAKQNDALKGLNTMDSWLYSLVSENYNVYDKRTGKMVDVSGDKPYISSSQLFNYYVENTNDNYTTNTKFGLFLAPFSTKKKTMSFNVIVFNKDEVKKYFQRKGITIDDNEPEPTGTDSPKAKKAKKTKEVSEPQKNEAQIRPTINENQKVDILVTETIKEEPMIQEIPKVTVLKNSHPVVVEFLDKCRFIDIEVLEDLFTVQWVNLLTNEVSYKEFKTGDILTDSMFSNMIGTTRAMSWNNSYENTMLAYLFDDLQGQVDTVAMKEYNDILMKGGFDDFRPNRQHLIIRDITQFNADWTQVIAFSGKPKTIPKALKQIQIQHNVKHEFFDFDEFKSIQQIKDAGLYDKFVSYAKNDVSSVRELTIEVLLPKFQMVVEAMESIGKSFDINDLFYFSGFGLIKKAFSTNVTAKDFNDYQFKPLKNQEANVFFNNINKPEVAAKSEAVEFKIMGATGSIGQGGLHAVHDTIKDYKAEEGRTGEDIDVASMYPNIIKANKDRFPQIDVDLYTKVITTRLQAKKQGQKALAEGLKLLLNSTYGIFGLNFEANTMYSKQSQLLVSFYGQHSIIDLLETIESSIPGALLIQANTDGIMIDVANDQVEQLRNIVAGWEKEYKLTMEYGKIDFLHQDNVNNYFYTNSDGKLKAKGSFDVENDGANFGSFYKPTATQIEVKMNQIQGLPIESIEPKPYYLKPRSNDKGNLENLVKYQPVYLCSKENATNYIERKGENIYFTTDKSKSSIECYVEGYYDENAKAKIELKKQKAEAKALKEAQKEADKKAKAEAKAQKEANKKVKNAPVKTTPTAKDIENYLTKFDVTESYMRLQATEKSMSFEEYMSDLIDLENAMNAF